MKEEQNERKSRALFYSVITVAIIVVAVVGATYAYFSTNIKTDEGAINVSSEYASLSLIPTNDSYSPKKLIPTANNIAMYGFANQNTISYTCSKTEGTDTVTLTNDDYVNRTDATVNYDTCRRQNNRCIDDNGQDVCGYYHMTISNTYDASQQINSVKLTTVSNTFTNLVFAVYVKNGDNLVRVTDITDVPKTENTTASTNPTSGESTINILEGQNSLIHPTLTKDTTVDYYIVTWIKEINDIQNDADGNSAFSGTLSITTVGGDRLTGTISAAQG